MPIDEYLRSIGDTSDEAGTQYKIAFPVWPNKHGHFGQVDAQLILNMRICVANLIFSVNARGSSANAREAQTEYIYVFCIAASAARYAYIW